jgi:outer membrane lipoprotein-sorting protein
VKSRAAVALYVLLCASAGLAQNSSSVSSLDQVLQQTLELNEKRDASLQSYSSLRNYRMHYKGTLGTKKAEMQVRVSYQQPGRKEFQILRESGDGLLRNKVLRKLLQTEVQAATEANRGKSAINKENYKFQFLGPTSDKGTKYYVFGIKPRRKEKYLVEGKIWINAEHFAIARLEGKPAKKPSFWTSKVTIHHEYGDINGFWLPVRNETNSRTRLGGHSELVIDYGRYTDVSGRGSGHETSPGRSE